MESAYAHLAVHVVGVAAVLQDAKSGLTTIYVQDRTELLG